MRHTDKPIAALRLETCFQDKDGNLLEGSIERAKALHDLGYYIYVVTPLTNTIQGTRLAMNWIIQNAVPYDELWAGNGLPDADEWYDPKAETL